MLNPFTLNNRVLFICWVEPASVYTWDMVALLNNNDELDLSYVIHSLIKTMSVNWNMERPPRTTVQPQGLNGHWSWLIN